MLLTELLNILLWGLGAFFIMRLLQEPAVIYKFPFVMSFGFAVFILPQVLVVYDKELFNTAATNRLFFMTLLCWIMCFIGWYANKDPKMVLQRTFMSSVNDGKLGLVAALYVMAGGLVSFAAYRMFSETEFENQQATGIVTILAFFSQLLFIGTALSLGLYLKNKSKLVGFFALLGLLYCFYIGVFQGRRQQTLYALFIIGVPLFLHFRIRPPRVLVVSALLAAVLLIPSMDQYRKLLKKSESAGQFIEGVFVDIDYSQNLQDFYTNPNSIELVNAGYEIEHTYRSGEYRLGFDYWNRLVFRFVPAQIVGRETKEFLMLEGSLFGKHRGTNQNFNPNYILGTTNTGMGDSFHQFDYFGSLFFLFLGWFMRNLWFTTQQSMNPMMISFYSILLIECLIALTHGTAYFFPSFITLFAFLFMGKLFAKNP